MMVKGAVGCGEERAPGEEGQDMSVHCWGSHMEAEVTEEG